MGGTNSNNTAFVFHKGQTFSFASNIQVVGGSVNGVSLKPVDLKAHYAGKTADQIYGGGGSLPTQSLSTSRLLLQDIIRSGGGHIENIGKSNSEELAVSENYYRLHFGNGEFLDFHGADLRDASPDLANIAESLNPGTTYQISFDAEGPKSSSSPAVQAPSVTSGRVEGNSYVLGAQDIEAFTRARVRVVSGNTTLSTVGGPLNQSLSELAVTQEGELRNFEGFSGRASSSARLINPPGQLKESLVASGNVTVTKEFEVTGSAKASFYRISFGSEHIVLDGKYMPKEMLAKVQGLEAKQSFEAQGYNSMKQLSGSAPVPGASSQEKPREMLHFGNSQEREYKGPEGMLPKIEGAENFGAELGRLSDRAGAEAGRGLAEQAAKIGQGLTAATNEGGSSTDLMTRIFKDVIPDLLSFTKGAAGSVGNEVRGAERGIATELGKVSGPLHDMGTQLEQHGRGIRDAGRAMGRDTDNQGPAGGRKDLGDKMPWLEQKSEAVPPPLPESRPPRPGLEQQRGEAKPPAEAAKIETASAKPPAGSTPDTSADRNAITWNGGPAKGYVEPVKDAQLALAAIDPKYKEMMTYTNKAGEKVFADGLEGGRTAKAMAEYAKDYGLNPKTLQLADLIKHAQVIASAPAADGTVQGVDGSPDDRYRIAAMDEQGVLTPQFTQAHNGPQVAQPAPDNALDAAVQASQLTHTAGRA